jgi:hypothetical protein
VVRFVTALPRNELGKILKRELGTTPPPNPVSDQRR